MKKILIVEDDPDFQDIYGLYLRSENYQVLKAFNGKQALELLEKETTDLIVLDLIMPVMDGEEFYARLRAEEKWKRIPVITASVNDKTPDRIAALGGLTGSLRKPFDVTKLIQMIKTCLG